MELIRKTNVNFLRWTNTAVITSATLILIGIISLFIKHGPNLGIDFTGGTLIQIRFTEPKEVADIRDILGEINLEKSTIQQTGEKNETIIRIPQMVEKRDINTEIKQLFLSKMGENSFEIRRIERVGPKIGEELRSKAVWAVISSIAVIILYISFRFEFRFAIGALVALVHDVLITLGVFSVLNMEISLSVIAAFLTIVGYSLNDTIVIFDRIRENMKIHRRLDLNSIINNSINETLSRTIITALTTWLVVFILFIAGGEVIHTFSAAMLIGVGVGTYSSIYIASPIVILWQNRFSSNKKK